MSKDRALSLLVPQQTHRPSAHRELALAVIVQAIRDLDAAGGVREDAQFFFDSPAVSHWCGVAGLDPTFVQEVARKFRELGSPSKRRVRQSIH